MARKTTVNRRRRKGAQRSSDKFTPLVVGVFAVALITIGIFSFVQLWKDDVPQKSPASQGSQSATPSPVEQVDYENADKLISEMTLDEKVYQMMFVTPESITGVGTATVGGAGTKAALETQPVGGIVYFSKNMQSPEQLESMLKHTQSYSKIPLFMGVDEEGGRVARIASVEEMGVENLPPMKEIGESGDTKKAYEAGTKLAKTVTTFGFNVNFAPVADLLLNEKNTEIGDRSFGSDPSVVAPMVSEVVKGLKAGGSAAVLKHFPGHASTDKDSHLGPSASARTYAQLQANEFVPFKAGIDAGAEFVMLSHATYVSAVDENVPASLSKTVVTDWLRGELGFNGVILTDSFQMGAITEKYGQGKAAVKAVQAGADMILMPTDVTAVHKAIVDAVKNGEISEERINESVRRVLVCKAGMGLL